MISIILTTLLVIFTAGLLVLVGLVAAVGSIFAAPLAMDILWILALMKLIRRRRHQLEVKKEVS